MHDTLSGKCSKAIVITNDSDLAEPIHLAVKHGIKVGIVNPHNNPTSRHLRNAASFIVPFRRQILVNCQLPNTVTTAKGKEIHRPAEWKV